MHKTSLPRILGWSLSIAALAAGFAVAHAVYAKAGIAGSDSRVSSVEATAGSTAPGATTSYTVSFTTTSSIPSGGTITFQFQNAGCPEGVDWTQCQFDFESATLTSSIPGMKDSFGNGGMINLSSSLPAGTYTATFSNVSNPGAAGVYLAGISTFNTHDDQDACMGDWENPCDVTEDPILIGNIAVWGRVTTPQGAGVPFAYVQLNTKNFSFFTGSSTSQTGYYGIAATGLANGIYQLTVNPSPQTPSGLVAPDPVDVMYSGSTIVKNMQFQQATKTLTGTVTYNTGSTVSSAQINAYKNTGEGGGSFVNTTVNSNGSFSLSLTGGEWEISVEAPWGQNGPETVDWFFSGERSRISFANNSTVETKTQNITVQKATALVEGKIVDPDGHAIQNGSINFNTHNGPGINSGLDQSGEFSVPIGPGTYKVGVWSNDQSLYLPTTQITVSDGQTLDLGTLKMKEKNSRLTGKIVDENNDPIEGINVNTWLFEGEGWGNTQTGANGTFAIPVFAGRWGLDVYSDQYINTNRQNDHVIKDNETVDVGTIQLLTADATVNLTVLLDGEAMTNVFGWSFCRDTSKGHGPGAEFGGPLDRGRASIPLLGGQTYECGANLPPDIDFSASGTQQVTLEEGQTKSVSIDLVANDASVRIVVQDQNGNSVKAQAEVGVFNQETQTWRGERLGDSGEVTVSVLGGLDYFVDLWFPDPNAGYLNSHGGDVPLTAISGETVTKVVTAFKADATVNATVLDPDGNPIKHGFFGASNRFSKEEAGAPLGDFKGGRIIDTGTEIFDGHATLALVGGETYEFFTGTQVQNGWMPPQIERMDVATGDEVNLTLKFREPDAVLHANVSLANDATPEFGFCHAWGDEGFSGGEVFGGQAAVGLTIGTWYVGCDSFDGGKMFRSDETIIIVSGNGDLENDFTLEESRIDIPEGFSGTFDVTQQKTFSLPDGTSVMIPANAAGQGDSATYSFTADPNVNLFQTKNDRSPFGWGWDFNVFDDSGATANTFNSDVTITIPYNEDVLADFGVSEDEITAKFFNSESGSWQSSQVTVDTDNNTISIQVTNFTTFAITAGGAATLLSGATANADILTTPWSEGGPQVTLYDENGHRLANFFAYDASLRVGIQAITADVNGDGINEIVTVPTEGGATSQVRVFDAAGNVLTQWFAYPTGYRGGALITAADVDGDGKDEIISSPLAGGPQVRVFDGETGEVQSQFLAYASTFRGGLTVGVGDVNGDGNLEIVTAPASDAGPHIRVFDKDGYLFTSFFAYDPGIRGGYNLTLTNVDGDSDVDIIVSPKSGNGPQVAVLDGNGSVLSRFMALDATNRSGIWTLAADIDGDGTMDIVTSAMSGGPQVRVFATDGTLKSQFFALDASYRGSFPAIAGDLNGDGTAEIIVTPGPGYGPQVQTFDANGNALSQFWSHATGFRGGVRATLTQ